MNGVMEDPSTSECSQPHDNGGTKARGSTGVLKKLFRRGAINTNKKKKKQALHESERNYTLDIEQETSCASQPVVINHSTHDDKSSASSSKDSRRTKVFAPLSKTCGDPLNTSKLLMGLKASDVEKIVSCIDYVGSNVLHLACYRGASLEAIHHLLSTCSPTHRKMLVNARDRDGRVPIQIAVECICREKMDLEQGMEVVQALHEADPFVIHNSDENMHNTVDIVFMSLVNIHSQSEEYKRLMKLYSFVRTLSIEAYKEKKKLWERNGSMCKNKSDDNRTQNTESTGADRSSCLSEMSAIGVMKVHEQQSNESDGCVLNNS